MADWLTMTKEEKNKAFIEALWEEYMEWKAKDE